MKPAYVVPSMSDIAKELSLAGIQRPLRRIELPANSEPFSQFGEFVGFIIEITER